MLSNAFAIPLIVGLVVFGAVMVVSNFVHPKTAASTSPIAQVMDLLPDSDNIAKAVPPSISFDPTTTIPTTFALPSPEKTPSLDREDTQKKEPQLESDQEDLGPQLEKPVLVDQEEEKEPDASEQPPQSSVLHDPSSDDKIVPIPKEEQPVEVSDSKDQVPLTSDKDKVVPELEVADPMEVVPGPETVDQEEKVIPEPATADQEEKVISEPATADQEEKEAPKVAEGAEDSIPLAPQDTKPSKTSFKAAVLPEGKDTNESPHIPEEEESGDDASLISKDTKTQGDHEEEDVASTKHVHPGHRFKDMVEEAERAASMAEPTKAFRPLDDPKGDNVDADAEADVDEDAEADIDADADDDDDADADADADTAPLVKKRAVDDKPQPQNVLLQTTAAAAKDALQQLLPPIQSEPLFQHLVDTAMDVALKPSPDNEPVAAAPAPAPAAESSHQEQETTKVVKDADAGKHADEDAEVLRHLHPNVEPLSATVVASDAASRVEKRLAAWIDRQTDLLIDAAYRGVEALLETDQVRAVLQAVGDEMEALERTVRLFDGIVSASGLEPVQQEDEEEKKKLGVLEVVEEKQHAVVDLDEVQEGQKSEWQVEDDALARQEEQQVRKRALEEKGQEEGVGGGEKTLQDLPTGAIPQQRAWSRSKVRHWQKQERKDVVVRNELLKRILEPVVVQARADLRNLAIWLCSGLPNSPIEPATDPLAPEDAATVAGHLDGLVHLQDILDPRVLELVKKCLALKWSSVRTQLVNLALHRLRQIKQGLVGLLAQLLEVGPISDLLKPVLPIHPKQGLEEEATGTKEEEEIRLRALVQKFMNPVFDQYMEELIDMAEHGLTEEPF